MGRDFLQSAALNQYEKDPLELDDHDDEVILLLRIRSMCLLRCSMSESSGTRLVYVSNEILVLHQHGLQETENYRSSSILINTKTTTQKLKIRDFTDLINSVSRTTITIARS